MILEKKYLAVGLMSGTSLDGLDIVLCEFYSQNETIVYQIIDATTIAYDQYWLKNLGRAYNVSGYELIKLHKEYGTYMGNQVARFLHGSKINPDFIASHGHTIFHEPKKNLTFQLGDGASIAAASEITTISDFRSFDVALGGQGAPLVPMGDEILFGKFDYCLNLGGFANVSYNKNGLRIAFDICPMNIAINYLANKLNEKMDYNGKLARIGECNQVLLSALNKLDYYYVQPPKSLGREWFASAMLPLLESSGIPVQDQLRTLYGHIVYQLKRHFVDDKKVLVTGGGAKNTFLMELLSMQSKANIYIPDEQTVDFKEALLFAFLGLLRLQDIPNALSSVTGARRDNIGGTIYKI